MIPDRLFGEWNDGACTADCIKTGRNKGNRSRRGRSSYLTSRTVLLLLLLRAVRESLRAVPNTNVDNNERNKTRPVFETFAATTKLLPIYPFFFQNNRIESPIFARSRKSSAYYCINPLVPISFFFFIIRFSLGITGDGKMGDASIGCALFPAVIVAAARLVNIITSWFLFFFFFFLFFFFPSFTTLAFSLCQGV